LIWTISVASFDMKKRSVLIVPGFVADTYSEIEKSYVDLTAGGDPEIDYVWLVPSIRAKHNRFKHPESMLTLREPLYVRYLRERNIPIIEGDLSKYNVFANFRVFLRAFRTTDACAVYTHFGFERFWAAFFGKLFGKKTIWNEHWYSMGTKFVPAKRIFYRWFVDYFIAVSKYVARTLPSQSRVFTVLNAIEAAPVDAQDENLRRTARYKLRLPEDDTVVLMVAAFRPEKRHWMALSMCQEILNGHRKVTFVFVGDGPLRTAFVAEANALGLGSRIKVPGHADNIDDYYCAADLCILTSATEAFGYCVAEAMKFARPMVTFACGGPQEIIRHGETGILVEEGDIASFIRHVDALIADPAQRATIGRNASEAIRNDFSRQRWKQHMRRVIHEICRA
jgi:glycosyltransferase involved in cell wall biosynthesis